MTIPNVITMLRIVLIPVFGFLWWKGLHLAALIVFAVASLSDWLDGFLARVLDQRSRLGQILDPAADKLMLVVCFLVAAALDAVPIWLAALVIGRDVVLASGGALFAFVLRGRYPAAKWKPTRMGKYSTFAQVFTIFFALAMETTGATTTLQPYVAALGVTCAALTIVSGTQYLAYGIKAAVSGTVPPGGTA
jgi:cardiolipin synthase